MAQAIRLATQKLDSISFDSLLSQANPFEGPTSKFDLSGIRLITSSALVELAAACFALSRVGRRLVIIVDDSNVRAYLVRSNFVRTIQPVARFRPDLCDSTPRIHATYRPSTPLLIEVTKIESGADLQQLLDQVVSVLCNKLGYREPDAFDIATAVSEISQNTFEHNLDACGFFAMQVYGSGADRFLEIGIADFGDGLAATLNQNHKNRWIFSDRATIERATKLRVSEFDDPTHGTGLFHLLKIAYEHGGIVQVRRGAAKIRFRTDVPRNWNLPVPHMPGVQVALTLSAKESAYR
jgi:hypothetical protein